MEQQDAVMQEGGEKQDVVMEEEQDFAAGAESVVAESFLSGGNHAAQLVLAANENSFADRVQNHQKQELTNSVPSPQDADKPQTQHEKNIFMVDKIASVLNKVISTFKEDRFATPLRI